MSSLFQIPPKLKIILTLLLFFLLWGSIPSFSQEKFRKSPPPPDPLPQLNLPEIKSAVLSNELSVSVVQQKGPPIITLQLMVLSGEKSSPPDLPGLASFTTRMLPRGTAAFSFSEIQERIESIGGDFSTSTHMDYSLINFSFLEQYLDEALQLLSRMILHPDFNKQEIANLKRSINYELMDNSTNPKFLSKRLLYHILFQDHPYQNMAYTKEDINQITQKDISEFFENHYRPNNAKITLVGNLSLSTATRKVSHYLNTWRNQDVKKIPPSFPELNKKLKICFMDVPRVKNPIILVGNLASPINHPDFFPFTVLNQVLGGTPTSRLFMNLRESKGYAFYSFSRLELFKSCGVFSIESKVRPQVIFDSVQAVLNEVKKVTQEPIPSDEIEQAKSYLIGNFPLALDHFRSLSLQLAKIQAYNLGQYHWEDYYEKIKPIGAEGVFKVVKKYPLSKPVVIIAGEKEETFDYLQKFEEIYVYDSKGKLKYVQRKKEKDESY
ncbi:insulinase family protein [bacterium]|nr:insulinase family protein [bacterium]